MSRKTVVSDVGLDGGGLGSSGSRQLPQKRFNRLSPAFKTFFNDTPS
jgi:hypothetical protein